MASKSLLIIGKHEDSYIDRNARRLHMYAKEEGIESERIGYDEFFSSKPISFKNQELVVMLFFPHSFWDENCETPKDTKLYGTSRQTYELFRQFFSDLEGELWLKYGQHRLEFLIEPINAFIDRDKIRTIEILAESQVPVTESITTRNAAELLDQISPGQGIFIKCRYGAEGKGITCISANNWSTNYKIADGKICNYETHDPWTFTDITGRRGLLEELLGHEVIVEKEIVTPELEPGTKFDLRVYVLEDEVPHMFLRINQKDRIITNHSQGARVEHGYRKWLGPENVEAAQNAARSAAKTMKSRFIGIDCMFNKDWNISVVEAQVFTDFPCMDHFNLAKHLAKRIKIGNL